MKYNITKEQFNNLFPKYLKFRNINYKLFGGGNFINEYTKKAHFFPHIWFTQHNEKSWNNNVTFQFIGDKDNLEFVDHDKKLHNIMDFYMFPPEMVTEYFVPIVKEYLKNAIEKGHVVPGEKVKIAVK